MGRGVFWMANAETVIIDHESVYGAWDTANPSGYADIEVPDDAQWRDQDFIDSLRGLLPRSYQPIKRRWRDRDSVVIAENRFFEICVTAWECDFYVSVALRDGFDTPTGFHPLAVADHHRAALAVWAPLALSYPLRVRTNGWTTARYDVLADLERSAMFFTPPWESADPSLGVWWVPMSTEGDRGRAGSPGRRRAMG